MTSDIHDSQTTCMQLRLLLEKDYSNFGEGGMTSAYECAKQLFDLSALVLRFARENKCCPFDESNIASFTVTIKQIRSYFSNNSDLERRLFHIRLRFVLDTLKVLPLFGLDGEKQ